MSTSNNKKHSKAVYNAINNKKHSKVVYNAIKDRKNVTLVRDSTGNTRVFNSQQKFTNYKINQRKKAITS